MGLSREEILEYLKRENIEYDIMEHSPVNTIEEVDELLLDKENQLVKNLFLRDDKKRNYYLVSIHKYKTINLKELRTKLESRPLSFASKEALNDILELEVGSVTPLGILNDKECKVEVVFDSDIKSFNKVGIHPNKNTTTIWIKPDDLEAIIENHGNKFLYIDI